MKIQFVSSLLSGLVLFASAGLFAQSAIPVSYFPTGDVQAILSQPGCRGLRVYPVYDESSKSNSTMIIGIDEYGNEISNDSSAVSRYRMYTGVNEDMPSSRTLSRNEAQTACSGFNSKNSAFVSDLSSTLLAGYIGEGSEGLQLSYTSSNGSNFETRSYRHESGLQSFGAPSPGDPCPSSCGTRSQYLCSPTN